MCFFETILNYLQEKNNFDVILGKVCIFKIIATAEV